MACFLSLLNLVPLIVRQALEIKLSSQAHTHTHTHTHTDSLSLSLFPSFSLAHIHTHSSWLPAPCSPAGARAIRLDLFMRPSLSCPSAAVHSASITAAAGRHRTTGREGKRLHTHLSLVERQERSGLGKKERVFLLCISFCFHRKQLAFCLWWCCPSPIPPAFLFSCSDGLYKEEELWTRWCWGLCGSWMAHLRFPALRDAPSQLHLWLESIGLLSGCLDPCPTLWHPIWLAQNWATITFTSKPSINSQYMMMHPFTVCENCSLSQLLPTLILLIPALCCITKY